MVAVGPSERWACGMVVVGLREKWACGMVAVGPKERWACDMVSVGPRERWACGPSKSNIDIFFVIRKFPFYKSTTIRVGRHTIDM